MHLRTVKRKNACAQPRTETRERERERECVCVCVCVCISGENWGSAVCAYSLAGVNHVFDGGSWVEQRRLESAWLRVADDDVPTPRPAQVRAVSVSTLSLRTYT